MKSAGGDADPDSHRDADECIYLCANLRDPRDIFLYQNKELQITPQFLPLCPFIQGMTKKQFSRNLMLAAGILAVIVILCSQAFQKETSSFLSKIRSDKTEKKAEGEKKVIIAAPADAVTSGQAVEVEHANPSLIREILFDEENSSKYPPVDQTILGNFFMTMLRAVISPQAP